MEHLSDASFFGKLLLLPANVRLDWKVIERYKHSSLFGLIVSNKGSFITLAPGVNVIKNFVTDTEEIMLVFDPGRPFQPSLMFMSMAGAYPSESTLRCSTLG